MKLRIAKTGTTTRTPIEDAAPVVAGSNTVPSPTLESMIEGVREPLNRRDIVRQEVEFGNKPAPTKSTPSSAPAPPDLGEAIRKQRG